MAAVMDYYDIMIIGRTGMGKSTTADKLIIANPDHLNYAGEQHQDEIMEGEQLKMSGLGVWLISDAEDEIERVSTHLKNLVFYRSLDNPHKYVNFLYKRAEMATMKLQLISNETTKVRVLDVPGFFGKEMSTKDDQNIGEKVTTTGLSIMRKILQVQSTMRMKFRRIIYFIPERGPLERSHKVLQMELEQMVHYFGKSIFECMVLVATVNPDIYQYLPPDIVPFSDDAKQSTRKIFQAVLTEVLPKDVVFPYDKPPIVFLSMNDSCEDVMKKIKDAPVVCDELKLAFEHRTCIRCGLKAKILKYKDDKERRVACYAGQDPTVAIPYEESHCHPLIISKHWTITKIVGGIAHFVTARRFIDRGWWPDFHNPDDEICIACRRVLGVPGEPGCTKVGNRYKGQLVDHTPIEPVLIANQDQPGKIAMNLEPHEDIEADEYRQCEQQPAEAENPEKNVGEQQQQVKDVKSGIPMAVTEAMKQANVSFVEHNVLECNYSGIEYTNKKHNFSLQIPEGAIPRGEKIHFKIAIAMHGPFILPKDTRLVSPILWLCPLEENVTFNKPFQVIIPHILHKITEEKVKKYQLGFAKANHWKISYNNTGDAEYSFQPLSSLECDVVFSSTDELDFGTATMNHFCYLCITAKNTPELKSDISYCLTRAERPASVQRHEIFFCASYYLGTCIEAIRKQFKQEEGYALCFSSSFKVSTSDCINIFVQDDENCVIARNPRVSKIWISKVDFQAHHYDEMRLLHDNRVYPPRVRVSVDMTTSNTICLAYNVEGTDSDQQLSGELLLPFNERPTAPPIIPSPIERGERPFEVSIALRLTLPVASNWKVIGALLGISNDILSKIATDEAGVQDRLLAMLNAFSCRRPPPTWKALAEAVECVNPDVAEKIRRTQSVS